MSWRRATALAVVACLVAVTGPPAHAASLPRDPQATWQTVGTLDSHWKNTGGRVRAIAIGKGATAGRVFIGGRFTSLQPGRGQSGSQVTRVRVAALDLATGTPLPFDVSVTFPTREADAEVADLQLSPDGATLYIAGLFRRVNGEGRQHLAAVDALTGALKAFSPNMSARVNTLAFDATGTRLFVGGHFTVVNGVTRNHLVALDVTTGRVDATWHPSVTQEAGQPCPPRCFPTVSSIVVSPDGGTVYFAGSFAFVDGVSRNSTAAVAAGSGALAAWDPNVYAASTGGASQNVVYRLVLWQSRVFVCGDFWSLGAGANRLIAPNVAAVDAVTGVAIASFAATTDGGVNDCALAPSLGLLVFGGHFAFAGGANAATGGTGSPRLHIAAADVTSGALANWDPSVNSSPGVYSLAADSAYVIAGGEFTTVNGLAQTGYAQWPIT